MQLDNSPPGHHELTLGFWVDPEVAFVTLFSKETNAFWLDSGADATTGVSYLGSPSPASVTAVASPGGEVTVRRVGDGTGPGSKPYPGSIFDLLRESERENARPAPQPDGFTLGWVGWFGYELGAVLVGSPHHRAVTPDAALIFADRTLAFDHTRRTVTMRASRTSTHPLRWIEQTERKLTALVGRSAGEPLPAAPSRAHLRHHRAEYLDMVRQCREAIDRGDAYQICLTNEITIETALDPLDVYRRLRRTNASHHGGFVRTAELALASSTPERFLEVSPAGRVVTRPIKGTRPRGDTDAHDEALRVELANDEKEIAENIMIVDLMRNDLNRIAQPGTVEVSDLLKVESYANVHQLVSTVSAQLAHGLSWVDVLESCLPGGSMTGAPKHSAMTIIDRLERGPRGPYAGAFGYMADTGRVDLAMIIRSMVITEDASWIGVGGGITALSKDEAEFAETLLKAEPLLAAAGAVLDAEDRG